MEKEYPIQLYRNQPTDPWFGVFIIRGMAFLSNKTPTSRYPYSRGALYGFNLINDKLVFFYLSTKWGAVYLKFGFVFILMILSNYIER